MDEGKSRITIQATKALASHTTSNGTHSLTPHIAHSLSNIEMYTDFFKDYPVHDDAAPTTADTGTTTNDFVLADAEANGNGHMMHENDAGMGEMMDEEGAPPPDDAEPECAAVTEWRAAFAKGLEEKMRNEREVKTERAERARETLSGMYGKWEERARDMKERNERVEKEFMRERDGVISRMSKVGMKPSWDIVPELVDMSGKYKEGARDTSRMRQVLMRMKTN